MKSSSPIEACIRIIRGQRIMLDADLARLYGVQVKVLNQAVRRNTERFPPDFMFQLTWEESEHSRSQFVTLNESGEKRRLRGENLKYRPLAFTEQGVAMLSSVLKSKQAVQANVEIMRAFVRLRGLAAQNAELGRRLDALESKYDRQFPTEPPGRRPPLTSVVGGRFPAIRTYCPPAKQ